MAHLEDYQNAFLMHLSSKISQKEPRNLYLSLLNNILQLGGKRLRPILSLMSADIFGGQSEKMPLMQPWLLKFFIISLWYMTI